MIENVSGKDESAQETPTSLVLNGPEVPPHHPLMGDIYDVGPDKPLGYLPLDTIRAYSGQRPGGVADMCSQRGLTTKLVPKDESRVASGALYVYDSEALQDLLNAHQAILDEVGWSTEPANFVDNVIKISVYEKENPDLYALIALAFKDPRVEYGGQGYDTGYTKISLATKAFNLLRSRT